MKEILTFLVTILLVYLNDKLIVKSENRRENAYRIFVSVNIPVFILFIFLQLTSALLISAFFYSLYFVFYTIVVKILLFNNLGKDSPQAKLGFVVTNLMVSSLFGMALVYFIGDVVRLIS